MIRTKNLIISKVSHRHADALFRIYGDVENNAYNPSPPFPSIEHSQSVLKTWIEHWSAKDIRNHAISMTSDKDYIIGFGGFSFKKVTSSPPTFGEMGMRLSLLMELLSTLYYPGMLSRL